LVDSDRTTDDDTTDDDDDDDDDEALAIARLLTAEAVRRAATESIVLRYKLNMNILILSPVESCGMAS
jgi:hypothetical protein